MYNRFTKKSEENNYTNNDYEIITEVPGDEEDMHQWATNTLGIIEDAMVKYGYENVYQVVEALKAMKEGGHEMGNLWRVTGVNPENQYETHTIEARTQREAIEQFQIRYPDLAVIRSVKFVSGPRQPGGIHKR